jgi:hypothetical protein
MKTKIYLSIFAGTACAVTGWQGLPASYAQSFVGGTGRSTGLSITVGGVRGFPVRGYAATGAGTQNLSSTTNGGGLSGRVNTNGTANTGVGGANFNTGGNATVTGTNGITGAITGASANGGAVVTPGVSGAGVLSTGGYTGFSVP